MGARPTQREGRLGSVVVKLLLSVLLLTSGLASANRVPKLPRLLSKVKASETLALHPTSTPTNTSEPSELGDEQVVPKSQEVAKRTTLSALIQTGLNQTSEDKPLHPRHFVGTHGNLSTHESVLSELGEALNGPKQAEETTEVGASSTEEPEKENLTALIKSRLRSTDVLQERVGGNSTMSAKSSKAAKHAKHNTTELRKKRSKVMDVVITHFDPKKTQQMVDLWLNFLQLKKVQELKPYVFLYCQNEHERLDEDDLKPILQLGGELVHLPNIGRESHSYLEHITSMYTDLAEHTLFAQDIFADALPGRFDAMFESKTGFLPLSLVGHVDCETGQTLEFLPAGLIPQIYSMFAGELCPPVGYTAGFEGQFVVSKRRVTDHSWLVYRKLLDLLRADEDHWIHEKHSNSYYKHKENPLFGHVMERTWSVAFNCFESWRAANCADCIWTKGMHDCGSGACQCYDRNL